MRCLNFWVENFKFTLNCFICLVCYCYICVVFGSLRYLSMYLDMFCMCLPIVHMLIYTLCMPNVDKILKWVFCLCLSSDEHQTFIGLFIILVTLIINFLLVDLVPFYHAYCSWHSLAFLHVHFFLFVCLYSSLHILISLFMHIIHSFPYWSCSPSSSSLCHFWQKVRDIFRQSLGNFIIYYIAGELHIQGGEDILTLVVCLSYIFLLVWCFKLSFGIYVFNVSFALYLYLIELASYP